MEGGRFLISTIHSGRQQWNFFYRFVQFPIQWLWSASLTVRQWNKPHFPQLSGRNRTVLPLWHDGGEMFCKVFETQKGDQFLGQSYLLTYSMVQSPSWEANWFAANQEIPRISRNPKVHYRTHKLPPPVSILDQPNPVHIPTFHLLEIHPNIIHPSTPRSSQWSASLRFPHQDPIHPLSSPIRATCLAHLILSPAQYWVRSANHLAPRY